MNKSEVVQRHKYKGVKIEIFKCGESSDYLSTDYGYRLPGTRIWDAGQVTLDGALANAKAAIDKGLE